jgi:hypothetical protein
MVLTVARLLSAVVSLILPQAGRRAKCGNSTSES